jgi:hypothetical protein
MTLPNKLAIGLDSVIVEKATYHKISYNHTLGISAGLGFPPGRGRHGTLER